MWQPASEYLQDESYTILRRTNYLFMVAAGCTTGHNNLHQGMHCILKPPIQFFDCVGCVRLVCCRQIVPQAATCCHRTTRALCPSHRFVRTPACQSLLCFRWPTLTRFRCTPSAELPRLWPPELHSAEAGSQAAEAGVETAPALLLVYDAMWREPCCGASVWGMEMFI